MPTNYYVSTAGNNSNNGLGPDATTANTNKPWLTLAKALGSGSPVVPGDTVYFGPGYFYSSSVTTIAGVSSSASPTKVIGDPTNAQGFKDSSGVKLAPGLSWLTKRSSGDGNDGPISTGGPLIDGSTNGTKGLQFSKLVLEVNVGSSFAPVFVLSAANSTDWSFDQCRMMGDFLLQTGTTAFVANHNLTVRRCIIFTGVCVLNPLAASAPATANIDINWLFENNLILGCPTSSLSLGPSGGNLAGGIRFKGNTVLGGLYNEPFHSLAGQISTTTPCRLEGNNIIFTAPSGMVNAGTSGQWVDDGYNRYAGNFASTNFTPAATTKNNPALNLVLPDLVTLGLEMPRVDFLGWTDAAASTQAFSAWTYTGTDIRGREVRPHGGGPSIGCWEAEAIAQDTGSAISGGGANSLKLTGAGEWSMWVPVDALATTISSRTKSTSYGGTTWPQLIVMPNPAIGITSPQSVSATSASDQLITSPSFTPTAKGMVEIRLVSNSTSTTSSTFFDSVTSP